VLKPDPFTPHRLLRGPDAQTIAGWALKPRAALPRAEDRLFKVAAGVQVLCRCHWQPQAKPAPEDCAGNSASVARRRVALPGQVRYTTLLLVHGLEGSSESNYMLGTAQKAFAAGMNVARMNIRNCGGTERLSSTLYHSGLSEDLAAVAEQLAADERTGMVAIAGFSLGGNQALKLAGEWGARPPAYVKAVAAVSPAMDLAASCDLLHRRRNRVYEWQFLRSLKRRVKLKRALPVGDADANPRAQGATAPRLRSMREFDDVITAPAFGFAGAADYYARASASRLLPEIRVPTLLIYAADDPFICVLPETRERLRQNPRITVMECRNGGHCGFIGAGGRRWAEEKVVEFVSQA